ncbi:hypothetical protein QTI66_09805 [Variovorax sp. J22R133]|uniref:hypothetical protein n=1 Tax=Variovorax brevis TaxID=3053503 RepID=UPI0025785EA2|nr:hypothetical protein [Variovorax sp. J22R133]MDM0112445.1 hypothetical protein [Variovorax sp. J22R133]
MGIALLTFADLITPLQAFATRLMTPRRSRRGTSAPMRYVAIRPSCAARGTEEKAAISAHTARPLRVVRVVDNKASGRAGRVVISGRMADVCAELDRLAALEARELSHAAGNLH